MNAREIKEQLENLVQAGDFVFSSYQLVDVWTSTNVGFEVVEPVLEFMEEHPSIDFGTPGPLVHFIERFYGKGYEEKLLESIRRKPTTETVIMLNRIINGTKATDKRQIYIAALEQTKLNPLASQNTFERVNELLQKLKK